MPAARPVRFLSPAATPQAVFHGAAHQFDRRPSVHQLFPSMRFRCSYFESKCFPCFDTLTNFQPAILKQQPGLVLLTLAGSTYVKTLFGPHFSKANCSASRIISELNRSLSFLKIAQLYPI
jgi:hypothetical protein